jgi:tungstate transport system substrate-binding protein
MLTDRGGGGNAATFHSEKELGKMKKIALLILAAMLLLLPACSAASTTGTTTTAATTTTTAAATTAPANKVVRLSTTTSVNDSGLLPVLQPLFEKATGYKLEIIANGSGAAIKLGESGDADVLLVHSKAAEETFVQAGYGLKRISFMHNFFIIAGPEKDPAKVKSAKTAVEAFKLIAAAKAKFISRGDASGTNTAELKIWTAAGITPTGSWYISAGKGMGPSLTMASEMQAYILTDKATYLATKANTGLAILLGASDDMKNVYSLIAVNPAKNPGVNAEGAQAFINFMIGAEAQAVIKTFGIDKYGEALFTFDQPAA